MTTLTKQQIPSRVRKLLQQPNDVEAIQSVDCNGQEHWLAVINGSIVMLNHNLGSIKSLEEIGGPCLPCLMQYNAWRYGRFDTMLEGLGALWTRQRVKRLTRRVNHIQCSSWLGMSQAVDSRSTDLYIKTWNTIRWLLMYRCSYIQLEINDWLLSIDCLSYETDIGNGDAHVIPNSHIIKISLGLSHHWMQSVYRRGLAVVEDKLVLKFDPEMPAYREPGLLVGKAKVLTEPVDTSSVAKLRGRPAEIVQIRGQKAMITKWTG